MRKKDLIVNPYFIIGLIILILNDSYLKWEFNNTVTGKLSDFAGLLIFPMFLTFINKRFAKHSSLIVGIFFILWKSPLINPFLDFINLNKVIEFNRVIDYSDYLALTVLPFSHFLIKKKLDGNKRHFNSDMIKILRPIMLIGAFFAFSATSMVRYEMPQGTIYIGKDYSVNLPKDSVLAKIEQLGYNWTFVNDTLSNPWKQGYYQIENLSMQKYEYVVDTIKNVKFDLIEINPNKTKINLINVTLNKPGNVQNWKYLKRFSKDYKGYLRDNFIKEIDE